MPTPTPLPEPESSPLCGADPLARALARLQPMPAGVDGQKLLYLAGQAARDRAVTLWRRLFFAQCVLLLAIGGAAVVHFSRLDAVEHGTTNPNRTDVQPKSPPTVNAPQEPSPSVEPPAAIAKADEPADDLADYLRMRREVLTAGLGLLPDAKPQPAAPVNPSELEKSMHLPPGVLTAPYRMPETKKEQE